MARRYTEPNCVAIEIGTDLICGRPMQMMAEREPAFGPNWRPGHLVFRCRRCGAIRSLSKETLDRYVEAK